jgi:hypothetical protein
MKYTVRSKDGELTYASFGAVEHAWLAGLVDPEDELLEEGTTKWRRADSFPLLVRARRQGNQVWGGSQAAWIIIGVTFGSASLYLLVKGNYLIGGVIAIIVTTLLFKVTYSASKRTKPHP